MNRGSDIAVYRFVENLVLSDTEDVPRIKRVIDEEGFEAGLAEVKKICGEKFFLEEERPPQKRRLVKDEMIENYVVRNKLGAETLRRINMRMCLRGLCQKNVVFKNGEIVDIIIS